MPVSDFNGISPEIDTSVFIAPGAWIIGDVKVGKRSSVFFNAVVRGDIQSIRIGQETNLQEHVLVHSSHGLSPVVIGDGATIGHRAIIHGCSIGSHSLIGMGSTILDDAQVGEYSLIGAHSLVTKGTIIPPRSLAIGTPAKVIRSLTDNEIAEILNSAKRYAELAAVYLRGLSDISGNS
jgi:carbonic anhydrase/acetyltransferase-like protein (isoleucine patch superfamily)